MPLVRKGLTLGSTALLFSIFSSVQAAYYPPLEPEPMPLHIWYLGGTGGVTFVSTTHRDGITTHYQTANWDAGAEIGLAYKSWRFEAEYIYQPANVYRINGVTSGDRLRVQSGLFNILFDFLDEGDIYRPYVGAGVGYALVEYPNLTSNGVLGYQAQAGVRFAVYDNASFTLGYRFFGTTTAEQALGDTFQNNMINAGFIYFFD